MPMIARIANLCLAIIGFLNLLQAQQFGGNPPSLKWKQLNSDTARIIFPASLDSQARQVASVVHFLAARNTSLGNRLRKINIVLQNQTTTANGYVALGPYRSELFMTPPAGNFELGSTPWPEQLAVHEYRHVQQFNNFNRGGSRIMYYLFGEEGLSLAINAAVPDWFYEGDAVYNETVFTMQGRGRIPFFLNQYKALWMADKKYSWMKLRNGSLKNYVPSHYVLGYLLVNYGYEKYGAAFWKNVTQDAAAYQGLFYPFQRAVKKYSGTDYKTFRKEAFDFYKKKITEAPVQNGGGSYLQGQALQETVLQDNGTGDQKITSAAKSYVANYLFPYQAGGDTLFYLKNTYRHLPRFIMKDQRGEHRLRVKDISGDEQYSYRNGKIVYTAYKPDLRWSWRDYSELRLLDVHTGRRQKLTHKTKYFSPDISEDGSRVVAVHYDAAGYCELHILQASNGRIITKMKWPGVLYFSDPKFLDSVSVITAARLSNGQMALAKMNFRQGTLEWLTHPSFFVLGFLNVDKGHIYFTASYLGNDDLYSLDTATRTMRRLTRNALGNYFVNVKENKLVYAAFTAHGYQLRQRMLSDSAGTEITWEDIQKKSSPFPVAGAAAYSRMLLQHLPQKEFPVSDYRKDKDLFNFHSWRPYAEDPVYSYTLYGENVLNTLQTEIYYMYNRNEKTSAVGFSSTLGAWFPYLSTGAELGFNRSDSVNNLLRQWRQLDTRFGLSIPLNFSGGRFYRQLHVGSNIVLRNEFNTGISKNLLPENNFRYLSHFIRYSQRVPMARQHIVPRAGYTISLQHRHAVSEKKIYQFAASGSGYLPGIFSTHGIMLDAAFQQRDTLKPTAFSNRFSYARGYQEFYFSRMWKLGANYHLPLWLPDWGFGNIFYLQRIRVNAFYDYTKVFSRNKKNTLLQRSTGMEFYADTRWWNQYPLSFGLRISKLIDKDLASGQKGTVVEFILPVSIIPR